MPFFDAFLRRASYQVCGSIFVFCSLIIPWLQSTSILDITSLSSLHSKCCLLCFFRFHWLSSCGMLNANDNHHSSYQLMFVSTPETTAVDGFWLPCSLQERWMENPDRGVSSVIEFLLFLGCAHPGACIHELVFGWRITGDHCCQSREILAWISKKTAIVSPLSQIRMGKILTTFHTTLRSCRWQISSQPNRSSNIINDFSHWSTRHDNIAAHETQLDGWPCVLVIQCP